MGYNQFGVGTYNLTAYVYPIQGEVETNDNSYSYGYIQILPTNNSLIDVTIASIPSGKSFVKVDGVTVTTPTTFDWLPGSQHTIEALSSIQVGNGVQCVWTNWSDGGLQSHSFMVSNSSVVATANYQTQYQVLFSSSSQGKGTVTPNTATYYNAGSTISIFANPSSDYSFTGWLSSTPSISFVNSFASSTIATINDPGTITAVFATASISTVSPGPSATSTPSPKPTPTKTAFPIPTTTTEPTTIPTQIPTQISSPSPQPQPFSTDSLFIVAAIIAVVVVSGILASTKFRKSKYKLKSIFFFSSQSKTEIFQFLSKIITRRLIV